MPSVCECGRQCADWGDLEEHVISKFEVGDLAHGPKDGEMPERWEKVRQASRDRTAMTERLAQLLKSDVSTVQEMFRIRGA